MAAEFSSFLILNHEIFPYLDVYFSVTNLSNLHLPIIAVTVAEVLRPG